jgi:rhamnose transport system permease protein
MSTAGGKGTFPGVVIAIFTVGLLRYAFSLINLNPETVRIILGALLITVVTIQHIRSRVSARVAKKQA